MTSRKSASDPHLILSQPCDDLTYFYYVVCEGITWSSPSTPRAAFQLVILAKNTTFPYPWGDPWHWCPTMMMSFIFRFKVDLCTNLSPDCILLTFEMLFLWGELALEMFSLMMLLPSLSTMRSSFLTKCVVLIEKCFVWLILSCGFLPLTLQESHFRCLPKVGYLYIVPLGTLDLLYFALDYCLHIALLALGNVRI